MNPLKKYIIQKKLTAPRNGNENDPYKLSSLGAFIIVILIFCAP